MSIDAICLIICLAILGILGLIFILHGAMLQKEWEKWKKDGEENG